MTCVVADDEPLAINLLTDFIKRVPFLTLDGTYTNPFEAWEELNKREIDLIFLDINMPGLNGLQLAEIQSDKNLKIIFTTAYSEYAVEGFNLNATDYLLKPFSFERFLKAVNKAHHQVTGDNLPTSAHDGSAAEDFDNYVLIKSEHKMIRVNFSDIFYIESYKDYLKIHTEADQPVLTIRSLKSIEDRLPPGFIRIHKSFIISKDKIREIRNYKVKIKDAFLPVSETYRERFKKEIIEGKL